MRHAPFGIAVNPRTNRIYVANNNWPHHGTVSVIDGNTNQVITTIGMAGNLYGIAVNPRTNTITPTASTARCR